MKTVAQQIRDESQSSLEAMQLAEITGADRALDEATHVITYTFIDNSCLTINGSQFYVRST